VFDHKITTEFVRTYNQVEKRDIEKMMRTLHWKEQLLKEFMPNEITDEEASIERAAIQSLIPGDNVFQPK
jgi:hypothetical protein